MVFLFHLSLDFPEIAEIRGPISMNLNATNLWGPRDPCEDASIQVHQDGLPGRVHGYVVWITMVIVFVGPQGSGNVGPLPNGPTHSMAEIHGGPDPNHLQVLG